MKIISLVQVVFLGSLLYTLGVVTNMLTLAASSAIVALLIVPISTFISAQTGGAFPELNYLASWAVSFILIVTSFIGARGATLASK